MLRDRCSDYFALRPDDDRPYMSVVTPVAEARRRPVDGDGRQGFERLRAVRSDVPAVTHVHYSARLQTVDDARHGRFAALLRTFEARTGCPVMVNTSFNVRGEPIVRTPDDALRCFMATGMDALVLGRSVLLKERQSHPSSGLRQRATPPAPTRAVPADYRLPTARAGVRLPERVATAQPGRLSGRRPSSGTGVGEASAGRGGADILRTGPAHYPPGPRETALMATESVNPAGCNYPSRSGSCG